MLTFFFAKGGIEQIVEHITQNEKISVKEKKNFFETLKEIINKIVDVIKNYVTNNHLSSSEKAVSNMSLDDIKKLRTQFLDVIDGAIANLENGVEVDLSSTGIKFQKDISNYPYNMQSVIKNYIKSTSKKIVDFVSNYNKTSNFARLNLVPATNNQVKDLKILVGIDVTGFVNAVNTNALDHIEKRHGANGEADKSMANIEDIARMEYVIKNYDNIELLKNSNDEVKYSKEFSDKNNKPAPLVKYSKKINGTYYLIEAVVDSKFKKLWVVSAYINKNDTVTQTLNGENAPETDAHGELASPVSTNSISQNTEKSNIKKSLDVDTDGNILTKAQQEYFKDSKVRDENGRLKVVYRGGTNNDYYEFDRKKSKYSNQFGRGFYFTESKSHAQQYGELREFYLNITNPLTHSGTTFTDEQIKKFIQAVADNEDYGIDNYGYDATVDSVAEDLKGKSDYDLIYDVNMTCIGDLVAATELFNEINGTDFDGFILPTEIVTFSSEQSKLTDNKTPTKNPDMRFSLDVPVEKTKDLIAVHNISEEKLMKSLQLGGLPMPSIAVMKAKEAKGNSVYGNISLVFPKSTIDPSLNTDNKIYGGDAWTPVYPTVEYKINEYKANEIYSRARKATEDSYAYKLNSVRFHPSNIEDSLIRHKGESGLIDSFKNDYGMKQLYLAETGEPVKEVKMKETKTELSDGQVEMYDYLIENFGDTP